MRVRRPRVDAVGLAMQYGSYFAMRSMCHSTPAASWLHDWVSDQFIDWQWGGLNDGALTPWWRPMAGHTSMVGYSWREPTGPRLMRRYRVSRCYQRNNSEPTPKRYPAFVRNTRATPIEQCHINGLRNVAKHAGRDFGPAK